MFSLLGLFSNTAVEKTLTCSSSKIFLFVVFDAVAVKMASLGLDSKDFNSNNFPYHFLNGTFCDWSSAVPLKNENIVKDFCC